WPGHRPAARAGAGTRLIAPSLARSAGEGWGGVLLLPAKSPLPTSPFCFAQGGGVSPRNRNPSMFAYYLNLGLHSLRRTPVLTALMVLSIAIGIGAAMTTLTVMHLLSGDPLPGRSQHIFYPQVDALSTSKA